MKLSEKLHANVVAKLQFEPSLDESNITVTIKSRNGMDNIVVLGGTVSSFAERRIAEEAVETVEGIQGIANEILVELDPKYKRSDADIVAAALNSLEWTVLLPHEQIRVVVTNGFLTLMGEVDYFYEKRRAYDAVKNLPGVKAVLNKIKITMNVMPVYVKDKIMQEFERNARINANNIQVSVEGNVVILKGTVRNLDEHKEAKKAAWAIPGVTELMADKLTISQY